MELCVLRGKHDNLTSTGSFVQDLQGRDLAHNS